MLPSLNTLQMAYDRWWSAIMAWIICKMMVWYRVWFCTDSVPCYIVNFYKCVQYLNRFNLWNWSKIKTVAVCICETVLCGDYWKISSLFFNQSGNLHTDGSKPGYTLICTNNHVQNQDITGPLTIINDSMQILIQNQEKLVFLSFTSFSLLYMCWDNNLTLADHLLISCCSSTDGVEIVLQVHFSEPFKKGSISS